MTPLNRSLASMQKPVDCSDLSSLFARHATPGGVVQLAGLRRGTDHARRLRLHFLAPRLAKGISAGNLVLVHRL